MTTNKAFPGRVIFDHLPKTAGQAINAWLAEELGGGCITPNLIGNHCDLIRQYGGLYSVISAHVQFYAGEGLDPRYQYMTFFRDPVDRVVSWLYFVINNHDDSQLPELRGAVRRFLESEGQNTPEMLLGHISNVYVKHFCCIQGGWGVSDDKKIENSLAAIKQYDVVGVYEAMPRFLADVAALVGLPPPQKIARVNVTTQRPNADQISPAIREHIAALNQLDLRLYAEVVAWKASAGQSAPSHALPLAPSRWNKYERVLDRVVTTPEVTILAGALREGNSIRHGQLMTFDVDFFLAKNARDLEMSIHFLDSDRQLAFGTNSTLLGQSHQSVPGGSHRVSYHLAADLPAGKYTVGFALTERLPGGRQQELARRDVMYRFEVLHDVDKPFAGYCYLPTEISLCPTSQASAEMVVRQYAGRLAVKMPLLSMPPGKQVGLSVEISNLSDQMWVGDSFRPINLSYHWLDSFGEMLVFEGMRSPLPAGGVGPGQALEVEMLVEAPPKAGAYVLVPTLVQERVGWFEKNGFEAARLAVEVTAPHE